jgi:hypothetical protein
MYMATVTELATCYAVKVAYRRTVLSKALQNGTDTHDQRAKHDRRTPSVLLVEPWCKRHGEDRAELVASGDEPQNAGLDVVLALCVLVTIAEVCARQSSTQTPR